MTDILIREATARDLPEIGGLWRELQQASAAAEPRLRPNAQAADWFLSYLRGQLDCDTVAVYVAETKGVVVGYTFGQIMQRPTLLTRECGYIADLCVRADFRGRGLGRRLYERLRAWFLSRGIESIEVQVVRANPAAQTFWRKMGFNDFLRTLRNDL
ncbi:MAG: GNAT family N-acetyltransferase [Armatimonadetes bacterium]|nr:GNAT family N-acetyltransferase [Armatimonadota bacterium]